MKLTPSAVGAWASSHSLVVAKPASLKADEAVALIRDVRPDVMVVAAYGLLLPANVLSIPPLGCINIHASLLPRWRGAAPIQRALLAGDPETGISIMRMEAGLDTGPVLLERRMPIGDEDTTGSLTDRLGDLGAAAVVEALAGIESLVATPQRPDGVTYAQKISRAEARIDWTRSPIEIDRQVRAFNPAPGAESQLLGSPLKIWRARPVAGSGFPGRVLQFRDSQLVVACGNGALELLEIQRPGARRMGVPEFLRGTPVDAEATLGEKPLASP